jgi:hypothetical protein
MYEKHVHFGKKKRMKKKKELQLISKSYEN